MDIVCLGELLVDMFPAEVGRRLAEVTAFRPKPGGAPANVAVAAARLGARSAFVGKVGNDAFGHHLVGVLAREGVEVGGIRFDEHARTTMAFIALVDENTAEFVFYRNPGADMLLRPDELDRELLGGTKAFHFGSISLIEEPSRSATMEAMSIARAGGSLISLDVNYRPSLWHDAGEARDLIMATVPQVDLLKVNEVELELLTGSVDLEEGTRMLLDLGPELCVVTLGTEGSYFRVACGSEHIPAFRVETVDATGCGDAFVAGLLWGLLAPVPEAPAGPQRVDWRDRLSVVHIGKIVRDANAVGALTALTQGVIPALPTADQVDEFLAHWRE
jgi:fructokinase